MPKPGPWKNGIRKDGDTWTAKFGQAWSRGHGSAQEAREARARLITDSKATRGRQRTETVAQFAARWTRDYPREAASTNQWNTERISKFVTKHGTKRLTEITPTVAERFARENPGRLASLKAMFNDARREQADGLTANPFENAKKPQAQGRQRITPLTEAEVANLADTAIEVHGDYGRDVFKPLIVTAAWTGIRPAELTALEWRDIDWERAELHVRRQWRVREQRLVPYTKGYSDRIIPLAPVVLEQLRKVPRIEGQAFVFFTRRDHQRFKSDFTLGHYWGKVRERFTDQLPEQHWLRQRIADGGPQLSLYEARHFAASELARRGVDTRDIAKFLGHKDDGQLARLTYIHVDEAEARERVARVFRAS